MSIIDDTTDDIYGHLLDYQQTDEFKADSEEYANERRCKNAEAMRAYNSRYPHARKLREEAKRHKRALYSQQSGLCKLCGLPLGSVYEIDHIMPISKGGRSEPQNLCVVHRRCNSIKGARSVEE